MQANYSKYQALWIFLMYAAGIIIVSWFLQVLVAEYLFFAIFILFTLSAFLYFRHNKTFIYFVIPLIILSGMSRAYFDMVLFENDHLLNKQLNNQIVVVKGWISETHYRHDNKNRYLLECEFIKRDSIYEKAVGCLLLTQGKYKKKLKYGEQIEANLKLTLPALPRNPGAFNYRRYLQIKGVYLQARLPQEVTILAMRGNPISRYLLNPLRMKILYVIDKYVADPANSIMKAILLGEKQDIDRHILNDFQKIGVIHVLAISGLHVGIILIILLLFFSIIGFSYYWRVGLSLLLLIFYMALVDFRPSVVRAVLMAIFYYGARFSQRKVEPLNILAAAGLIVLLVDPRQIFSMGFQFSFVSVFSILYGFPRLELLWKWSIERKKWKIFFNKWIRQSIIVSSAAVLGITPLTWYYFGTLQIGAILSNIVIIPAFALFLALTIIFVMLAVLTLPGVLGVAYIANFIMNIIADSVEKLSSIPFMQIYLYHPSILSVFLLTALLLLLYNVKDRQYLPYILILFLIFSYFSYRETNVIKSDKLRITFVDVGQGDGAIIEMPNGETAVIDGGDRKFSNDAGLRCMIPVLRYYGINQIRYLIASHAHSDHIGGLLNIMRQIKTDTLVLNSYNGKTKLYKSLLRTAMEEGVTVLRKGRGMQLSGDGIVRFYILHPDSQHAVAESYSGNEVNNSSLVIKLSYCKTSVLFTGDLETNAESSLLKYGSFLKSDLLKVGHHGSKTSTSLPFLTLVNPYYSVISVGKRNKFYHPSRKTVHRLDEFNTHPLRTDHFGALVFESDGKDFCFVNWRK